MKKEMVYDLFDIETERINGTLYLISPIGPVRPLLKNGNTKVGKGVWTFSTLPTNKFFTFDFNGVTYTERGTCPCHCEKCYATKGFYNMPSVIRALGVNTVLARYFSNWTCRAIRAQIHADNIKVVRIHASGDFFSLDYIDMWHEIARRSKKVIFWTYTKYGAAIHAFNDLNNISVVKSLIPGGGLNFGHCEHVIKLYDLLKRSGATPYICKCTFDKTQHCNNCRKCFENDYVLFLEHSTEYDAELDPLYPDLKTMVMAQ